MNKKAALGIAGVPTSDNPESGEVVHDFAQRVLPEGIDEVVLYNHRGRSDLDFSQANRVAQIIEGLKINGAKKVTCESDWDVLLERVDVLLYAAGTETLEPFLDQKDFEAINVEISQTPVTDLGPRLRNLDLGNTERLTDTDLALQYIAAKAVWNTIRELPEEAKSNSMVLGYQESLLRIIKRFPANIGKALGLGRALRDLLDSGAKPPRTIMLANETSFMSEFLHSFAARPELARYMVGSAHIDYVRAKRLFDDTYDAGMRHHGLRDLGLSPLVSGDHELMSVILEDTALRFGVDSRNASKFHNFYDSILPKLRQKQEWMSKRVVSSYGDKKSKKWNPRVELNTALAHTIKSLLGEPGIMYNSYFHQLQRDGRGLYLVGPSTSRADGIHGLNIDTIIGQSDFARQRLDATVWFHQNVWEHFKSNPGISELLEMDEEFDLPRGPNLQTPDDPDLVSAIASFENTRPQSLSESQVRRAREMIQRGDSKALQIFVDRMIVGKTGVADKPKSDYPSAVKSSRDSAVLVRGTAAVHQKSNLSAAYAVRKSSGRVAILDKDGVLIREMSDSSKTSRMEVIYDVDEPFLALYGHNTLSLHSVEDISRDASAKFEVRMYSGHGDFVQAIYFENSLLVSHSQAGLLKIDRSSLATSKLSINNVSRYVERAKTDGMFCLASGNGHSYLAANGNIERLSDGSALEVPSYIVAIAASPLLVGCIDGAVYDAAGQLLNPDRDIEGPVNNLQWSGSDRFAYNVQLNPGEECPSMTSPFVHTPDGILTYEPRPFVFGLQGHVLTYIETNSLERLDVHTGVRGTIADKVIDFVELGGK